MDNGAKSYVETPIWPFGSCSVVARRLLGPSPVIPNRRLHWNLALC
jgi:hypothetical protein